MLSARERHVFCPPACRREVSSPHRRFSCLMGRSRAQAHVHRATWPTGSGCESRRPRQRRLGSAALRTFAFAYPCCALGILSSTPLGAVGSTSRIDEPRPRLGPPDSSITAAVPRSTVEQPWEIQPSRRPLLATLANWCRSCRLVARCLTVAVCAL